MVRNGAVERERYAVLKEMLEDRRREIQQKLRSIRETVPEEATLVKDAEEQSVDDFVQEVDFALMQMKSQTLQLIDQAMQRLEAGTYGVCADCGRTIGEARLRAVPFAHRCLACQEKHETVDRGEVPAARTFVSLDSEARNT